MNTLLAKRYCLSTVQRTASQHGINSFSGHSPTASSNSDAGELFACCSRQDIKRDRTGCTSHLNASPTEQHSVQTPPDLQEQVGKQQQAVPQLPAAAATQALSTAAQTSTSTRTDTGCTPRLCAACGCRWQLLREVMPVGGRIAAGKCGAAAPGRRTWTGPRTHKWPACVSPGGAYCLASAR